MSKHTPGPWKVCGYNRAILQDKVSMDGCSLTIAELPICMGPQHPNGYDEANAALMAAAPELLEALRSLYYAVSDEVAHLPTQAPSWV